MPRVRGVSPRRAKPAVPAEPPKRGRGRPRKIHSPPPIGVMPRIDVPLDEPSGMALLAYCSGRVPRITMQDAIRELLTAYGDSEEVRSAVSSWRAARPK